jgi:hypothetical protein
MVIAEENGADSPYKSLSDFGYPTAEKRISAGFSAPGVFVVKSGC